MSCGMRPRWWVATAVMVAAECVISGQGMAAASRAATGYGSLPAWVARMYRAEAVSAEIVGRSAGGRDLYLLHLAHPGVEPRWRVLFYAQQHGDEIAGREALLDLVEAVAKDPSRLPRDVGVWVMPMLNPDGDVGGRRRNGAGADLNRDHLLLGQPETRALHRVAREALPHVAVDCHEFTRDSRDYRERGWREWPLIMMDGLNAPLFDSAVVAAARRWVDEAAPVMAAAGFPYTRYFVGGVPPEGEQRHSTPDADDGRNGIGRYGGLSFIIESGVLRDAVDPNHDLQRRVDAYLALLWRFLDDDRHRDEELALIAAARRQAVPGFLPTNFFWANNGPRVTRLRVVDAASSEVAEVATANFMHDLVIKKSVATPSAYAIVADVAEPFRELLLRHGLAFETLAEPRMVTAERCRLERVEEGFDEVYNRYAGRQIVTRLRPGEVKLTAGSLLVPTDQPMGVTVALLLEPTMLYGLYQWPELRHLVGGDGLVSVLRIP